MTDRIYHGWIVREDNGKDYNASFRVEWVEGDTRKSKGGFNGGSDWFNPVFAVEFWDKKIGSPVKLEPTPLGAYRVYTLKEAR